MAMSRFDKKRIIEFIRNNHLKIKVTQGWHNYSGFVQNKEALVFDVEDLHSLQTFTAFIDELNAQKPAAKRILIRPAAGGSHKYNQSYSVHGVADAHGIIRLTGKEFKEIKSVDAERKSIVVGGAIQIGDLNKQLFDQHNLTLPTSSLNPYISLIGLITHSGIGTGKDQPAMPGLVIAMDILLTNGKIVRIDNNHTDFETIRAASLGLFGIVLNVEIQCIEAKKLECKMRATSLTDLFEEIKNGLLERDPYVSILIMPQYHPDELTNPTYKNVCIYTWRPVAIDTPDSNARTAFTHLRQETETIIYDFLSVGDFLCLYPQFIPFVMRNVISPMAVGSTSSSSVSRWYDSVHHQTGYPHLIEDTGLLFPTQRNGSEVIEAIKLVFTNLQESAQQREYPIMVGMYVRYLQGTNGGLSISACPDGQRTCSFDMVTHNDIPGHAPFQAKTVKTFMEVFGAKPHFGKFLPPGYQIVCPVFTKAVFDWYKANGLDITRSMLITEHFCQLLNLPFSPEKKPSEAQLLQFFQAAQDAGVTTAMRKDERQQRYKAAL